MKQRLVELCAKYIAGEIDTPDFIAQVNAVDSSSEVSRFAQLTRHRSNMVIASVLGRANLRRFKSEGHVLADVIASAGGAPHFFPQLEAEFGMIFTEQQRSTLLKMQNEEFYRTVNKFLMEK